MEQIIFDGHKFTKDKKTGYYLKTTKPRTRLHVYVWEYYNKMKVPKGCDIHHIDMNKDNNDISNLICVSRARHKEIHRDTDNWTEEQWDQARERMDYAREYANEWHKSDEGKQWHREHWEESLGKHVQEKQEFKCEQCGKSFYAVSNGSNRFCSNKCKSAWRRASGVDDVTRKCMGCGRYYKVNKYYADKQKYCSRECADKYGRRS